VGQPPARAVHLATLLVVRNRLKPHAQKASMGHPQGQERAAEIGHAKDNSRSLTHVPDRVRRDRVRMTTVGQESVGHPPLDEVGYVPLAEIGAEFLFQVIAERAERATLIVTTNLPFSEWTQVFPNPRLCKALLDRVTDRAHIIETGTESYRFRRTVEGRQKKKAS
jgi:hypothetical protein